MNLRIKNEFNKDTPKTSSTNEIFKSIETKAETKRNDNKEFKDLKRTKIEFDEGKQNPFIDYPNEAVNETEIEKKYLASGRETIKQTPTNTPMQTPTNTPTHKPIRYLNTKAESDFSDCVLSGCSEVDDEVFDDPRWTKVGVSEVGEVGLKEVGEKGVGVGLSKMSDLNVSRVGERSVSLGKVGGVGSSEVGLATVGDFRGSATIEMVEDGNDNSDDSDDRDGDNESDKKNDEKIELCKSNNIVHLRENFKLNLQPQQRQQLQHLTTNQKQLSENQQTIQHKQQKLKSERNNFFNSQNVQQTAQNKDSHKRNVISTERSLDTLRQLPSPTITSPLKNHKAFQQITSRDNSSNLFENISISPSTPTLFSTTPTTNIIISTTSKTTTLSSISPRAPVNLLWVQKPQEPQTPKDYLFAYQDKETSGNICWCLSPAYSNIVNTSPISTKQQQQSQQCCGSCQYSIGLVFFFIEN